MFIYDRVVLKYLNGEDFDQKNSHWVFEHIEDGKYLFEAPDPTKKENVHQLLKDVKKILANFTPFNINLYSRLFPNWHSIIEDMNVVLVVGCPKPFDAMVRSYQGKEYVIFDLLRFCDYSGKYDPLNLIKALVTHETAHLCLHKKYPTSTSQNYIQQLKYITFDEGFAHLLSFKENIEEYDFSTIINEHYPTSINRLQEAMKETDKNRQITLLEEAMSGPYWHKFACVSGMLFLAKDINRIEKIYHDGIDSFISDMGL